MRTLAIAVLLAGAIAIPAGSNAAASAASSSPAPVRVARDVVYARPGGVSLPLDVYRPPSIGKNRPAVILIHGGGFTKGDKAALGPAGARLAARGWVAFSVNYRLGPQFHFPAGHEDVRTAVRWIRKHARSYGVDRRRIGALGSSAGANLAATLGTWGSGSRNRASRVAAYVSWSGPMDLSLRSRQLDVTSFVHPYLGCSLADCPERWADASPITHIDRTDAPAFLAQSVREIVPVENATTMADRLRAVGVPVTLRLLPGSRHATAFAEDVWDESVAFLERYVARARR
jgi:acetyl esterase/lipase